MKILHSYFEMRLKKTCAAIVLLILGTTFSLNSASQIVTIPDPNFVVYLEYYYPSCITGNQLDTQCPGIVNEDLLPNLGSYGITNLTGVEFFINLIELDVPYPVSVLPALPPALTSLFFNNGPLYEWPPLPASIEYLQLSYTPIDSIFGLPANLKTFGALDCDSLVFVDDFPEGTEVFGFSSCDNLVNLPAFPNSVQQFDLYNMPAVTTLADFPASTAYISIEFCNSITTIPAISNACIVLDIENCSNVTSLTNLPDAISYFTCSNTNISELPELPANLILMNIAGNPNLSCLPVLPAGYVGQYSGVPGPGLTGTAITCLPNIPPNLFPDGYPVCQDGDLINNPQGCEEIKGIQGYAYVETAANCVYDAGIDSLIPNVKLLLIDESGDTASVAYTNSNGAYYFLGVQDTLYTVLLDTVGMPYMPDCNYPGLDTTVTLTGDDNVADVNFKLACKPGIWNDAVVLTAYPLGLVFPGQTHTLVTIAGTNIELYNLNCPSNIGGEIELVITGPVNYIGPVPGALTPSNVDGDTLTYTIPDFSLLTLADLQIRLETETSATVDQFVCVDVTITPSTTDIDLSNNNFQICYPVVNSYDPNIKLVHPEMVLPEYDDWLTYTIYFQNTGNAPALNIKLHDTLSSFLQPNTFELLAYSHTVNTQLSGNTIIFTFKNIYLPDSASDPEGSIGFVQFRIKPLPNLPDQTVIENQVYIYFDYNAPILTNTATTSYLADLQLTEFTQDNLITVYPNPSESVFNFALPEIESSETITIEIISVTGEKIMETTQANLEINQVNLQNYPEGIYILKVSTSDANYVQRILKN